MKDRHHPMIFVVWHVNDWKLLYDDAMKILTYETTLEELNYNVESSDYSKIFHTRNLQYRNYSEIDTESEIEVTSDEIVMMKVIFKQKMQFNVFRKFRTS